MAIDTNLLTEIDQFLKSDECTIQSFKLPEVESDLKTNLQSVTAKYPNDTYTFSVIVTVTKDRSHARWKSAQKPI